ncbi:MAG: beta-galactosidase [Chthoniobacteraceae bacterium]
MMKNTQTTLLAGSLGLAAILCNLLSGISRAEDARPFSAPQRIRYDAQCLTIDGKDTFIYSGAFHYFRCPKELWPDRFAKIKAAGFNAVETYTPWNWHEREMPKSTDDFSKVTGLQDFDDWLTMAEDCGLYVIVRPGPYICAEWDNGGFPLWLSALKTPAQPLHKEGWMRSDDPTFLAWTKHWFDAVCPIIAKHQITRKAPGQPGVILVQVENEYDSAKFSDEIKVNQVKALAQFVRADGIDVPLISCWTKQVRGSTDPVLRQIFDCCNFYPRWSVVGQLGKEISKLRREQPDAPLATTELQGGWLSTVGGKLSERQDGLTAAQIQNITLYAWQLGETITNYYMLFGGTNFDDWGGRNITTTYDYDAPIREHGGVGDRYQRVWALGQMLREHGPRLVRAQAVEIQANASDADVSVAERRAGDGSRYFFVRTDNHAAPRTGTAEVTEKDGTKFSLAYQLEPFGSQVLYLPPGETDARKGEWLPKPAPAIKRPGDLPAPVVISEAKQLADPVPTTWTPLPGHDSAEAHGVMDSHFLYYQIAAQPGATVTLDVHPGDAVIGRVGGELIPAVVSKDKKHFAFTLPAGAKELVALYDNLGHRNGPRDMEFGGPYGVLSVAGADEKATLQFADGGANGTERAFGEKLSRDEKAAGNDWTSVSVGPDAPAAPGALLTWYRMQSALPAPKAGVWVPWHLHLEAKGNGFIYVNGHCLGRYWQVGPQHDFYLPESWLHFGPGQTNTVVLNLRPLEKGVSVQAVQFVPDAAFAEYR